MAFIFVDAGKDVSAWCVGHRKCLRIAFKGVFKSAPKPDSPEAILAEIAATILDGSVPFENALKSAEKRLAEIDPSILAGNLEKALEKAMFEAAAKATEKKWN